MITNITRVTNMYGKDDGRDEYFGLSTDTKPTGPKVPNASLFYEMDTKKAYMYDLEHQQWLQQ